MLQLVLGGARSGKSEVAERLAERLAEQMAEQARLRTESGPAVVYLAPGQAWDEEMAERIRRHRERRNKTWTTVEETLDIPGAVRRGGGPGVCMLLDGLGTWISNLLLADRTEQQVAAEVETLLSAIRESDATVVVVSDETGLGVVPPSQLGRLFRDCLGQANRRVAAAADRALFVVAGIPIDLKALEVKR